MSYDLNRLRETHPPACTCVECTQRRSGRRGSRRGGGSGPGGRRRFGCLPLLLGLPVALAFVALLGPWLYDARRRLLLPGRVLVELIHCHIDILFEQAANGSGCPVDGPGNFIGVGVIELSENIVAGLLRQGAAPRCRLAPWEIPLRQPR